MNRPAYINTNQKKLLRAAVRQLGMDDETRRAMLQSVAGVSSSRDLTPDKFRDVMAHLQECGFEKSHGTPEFTGFAAALRKWRSLGHRPNMGTPKQLARIETDWHLMNWYWATNGLGHEALALRGFLRSRYGVSDLRFLRFADAHNCIEALKAIQQRKEQADGCPRVLAGK